MELHRKGRSLEVESLDHGTAPIPMGARVGPLLHSSGISGKDATRAALSEDSRDQVRHAFINLRAVLKAGGASAGDVVRITVYLKDNALREAINAEWISMFPDPHDRPARHILKYDLQGGMALQLEVMAYVDATEDTS